MKKLLYTLILTVTLFGGASHSFAADRYWVGSGSTAAWTATGNTNWSATSGGANNASVPTSSDTCYFEAGAPAVTIDNGATCGTIDFTGYTGTASHSGGANWNIYGSLTLASGMTLSVNAFTAITNFLGTSSYTLTTNGKEVSQVRINGSGLTITLQDNLTVASPTQFGNLTVTQGTFDSNGFDVTTGIFTTAANALTKVVTITNSTINAQSAGNTFSYSIFGSNVTVNATGSTINISGNQGSAGFGNFDYGTINISGVIGKQMTISGITTVDNLSIASGAGTAARVGLVNGFTINSGGTFTVAGNSVKNRMLLISSTAGTARTITNTGVTQTWSNADFQDVTLGTSYDASGITGGAGDAGGNTNITFTTATQWYMKATTNNGSANNYDWSENDNWYTATNGGGSQMGAGLSPLAQDSLQIDTNSFTTTSTIRTDMYLLGKDISFSGNSDTLTLTDNTPKIILGSLNLTGVTTNQWNDSTRFMARANATLTSAGVSWIDSIFFTTPTATLTLADALTTSSSVSMTIGTFDSAGYTMTSSTISISGGTQNPGSSTWVMTTSNTATFVRTGGTFNAGTSVLKVTGTTGETVFNDTTASPTYYGVWIDRGTNASDVGFRRAFTAAYIRDTGTVAHTIRFKFGSTYTFTDADPFRVIGSAGQLISIDSCTDSSTLDPSTATHTLSATNGSAIIDLDYLDIQHSVATQANTWYAGTHSTDDNSVATAGSGWIFTARPSAAVGTFSLWQFFGW